MLVYMYRITPSNHAMHRHAILFLNLSSTSYLIRAVNLTTKQLPYPITAPNTPAVANAAPIVNALLVDIKLNPLIPCPLVHPPAILDPSNIKNPPNPAAQGATSTAVTCASAGLVFPNNHAPPTIPAQYSTLAYRAGRTPLPRTVTPQNQSPTSSNDDDVPISDPRSRIDTSCAATMNSPPTGGGNLASGPGAGASLTAAKTSAAQVAENVATAAAWEMPRAEARVVGGVGAFLSTVEATRRWMSGCRRPVHTMPAMVAPSRA